MRQYIEQVAGPLMEEDWKRLLSISEPVRLGKGELLLEEDKVCRKIWYMPSGAVRFFEMNDGEERTTHFFLSPAMFTAYHSLITGKPSDVAILASKACELIALPIDSLSELYNRSHALERVGRIMAEWQFIEEFNRRRSLLKMNALERYEELETTRPGVFREFPLKDIATYLGITPVSLSRLRKYRLNLDP